MIINTNIDAMKSLRSLDANNRKNNKIMEKLSSGMKINRAADDSAGLAISTKMRAQIRGLTQDERNIDDGISMFNTAEGGMEQIENMIHRIRQLAVQSANDTNTDEDRRLMQKEVEELIEGIDKIASDTEFNTHKVLLGKTTTKTITTYNAIFESKNSFINQTTLLGNIGNSWSHVSSYFHIVDVNGGSTRVPSSGYASIDGYIDNNYSSGSSPNGDPTFAEFLQNIQPTREDAQFLADAIAGALNAAVQNAGFPPVTGVVTDYGNNDFRIGFKVGDGSQYYINFNNGSCTPANVSNSIGHGFIHNTTIFGGSVNSNTVTHTTTVPENNSYIIQVGPNKGQKILFEIPAMPAKFIPEPPNDIIADADISTRTKANDTIVLCDKTLDYVNNGRAMMGSHVNRLEAAMSNVTSYGENLSAAESRLRDANMSKEMIEQVKGNILTQASTAMLAQANQRPEGILQLLR